MPFQPRQRLHRVQLRRWSHSLAVRLPARLLREAGFHEDTPLIAELCGDGSLCLRAEARFDRLRFSWEQERRLGGMACTAPTWPLLRQLPQALLNPADSLADSLGEAPSHRRHELPAIPQSPPERREQSPTYVDTGVLLPLICREPDSEAHLRWFGVEQRLLVSSAFSLVEGSTALALKALTPAQHETCQNQWRHLLRSGGINAYQLSNADLSASLTRISASLAQPPTGAGLLHPLAHLHLATALASGCSRLISPDPQLRQAASRAGLRTHQPLHWPRRLGPGPHPWLLGGGMGDWPPPALPP